MLRMVFHGCLLALATAAIVGGTPALMAGADWPQWRGPAGDGVSTETGLPVVWNEQSGVAWEAALPEWGDSTPAIWEDALFITTQRDTELLLLKLDKRSGQIEWTRQVGSGTAKREGGKREEKFHQLHNLASPSPVTDGELVVVHFGNGDLAAYDFAGEQLWKHNLAQEHGAYSIWWGHANSPVLAGNLVISVCMQDSLEGVASDAKLSPSYLVAHDKRTGKEKWKTLRMTKADAEECDAYTTPILVRRGEQTELVVMGGNQLDAYDPQTGKQLWFLPGLIGGRTITGPTAADDTIYATQGMRGPLLAVQPAGEGELPRKAISWKYDQGTPDSCCPVVWDDLLFIISDNGIVRAFDAHDGRLQWTHRLPGDYKASPLAAEGRVYFVNTHGLCSVVSAARRFEKLAENQLDDEVLASPAVSGGCIFLRGRKSLYCLKLAGPSQ